MCTTVYNRSGDGLGTSYDGQGRLGTSPTTQDRFPAAPLDLGSTCRLKEASECMGVRRPKSGPISGKSRDFWISPCGAVWRTWWCCAMIRAAARVVSVPLAIVLLIFIGGLRFDFEKI